MKGLALAGGGVFGVGQAAILSRVKDLSKFKFLAGTSIGAVNCAAIATDYPIDSLVTFYKNTMPKIFRGYWWRRYGIFTPRYPDKELNKALQHMFSGRFGDAKVPLFVTSADLNERKLKVFFSGSDEDGARPMWEVMRMAVAAETYFQPWKGMGDGGMYANNPVMVAIAGARDRFDVGLSDLELCSIGTGYNSNNENIGSTNGWTYFRWGLYVTRALLEGAANTMHEFFASKLLLKKYTRIQFRREKGWAMDNAAMVDTALQAWRADIVNGIKQIDTF